MSSSTGTLKPLKSQKIEQFKGTLSVPGDKSISHRTIILGSLALGKTSITGLLEGHDVLSTINACRTCGVDIGRDEEGIWHVHGVGIGGLKAPSSLLDMGNSGTSTRLLMGLLSPYPHTIFFAGDASLSKRPMKRVITPLTEVGAQFVSTDRDKLPLAMTGAKQPLPISYTLPIASAQVKSALLLAGLSIRGRTTVIEKTPTRDHTERMLEFFDLKLTSEDTEEGTALSVDGFQKQNFTERAYTVPADPSSTAFPTVAALLAPKSKITIENVCINPGRIGLYETLKEMGASIKFTNERAMGGEPVANLEIKTSKLKAITIPADRAPSMIDEYPILAIAAACAKGTSRMEGLEELRVKESDRLQAIIDGLTANGVRAYAEGDTLFVEGLGRAPEGGGLVTTHFDHRIAMAFLVLGMVTNKAVTVDDAAAIQTSFPSFESLMTRCGARFTREHTIPDVGRANIPPMVIAIDGPAASGKGTLARRLADYFGFGYLDTGSLYRAVGMRLVYNNQDPHDKNSAIDAAKAIEESDFVNPRLRQEAVGNAASVVSAMPEVRQILLDYQREFARKPEGAVLDGRDIGTVVCPNAALKIFMTASLDTRADRRHRQLQGQGIEVVFDSVRRDLEDRDRRDSERKAAPLAAANDAVELDTTDMSAAEVFDQVIRLVEQKAKAAA